MTTQTPEARLLVVDDEPNIRELLATSLRFAGFEVATAAQRARGARAGRRVPARPARARRDAAGHGRLRRRPPAARRGPPRAGPVPHRARRDRGQGHRPHASAATTTSPSRSASRRSSPASAPCCAARGAATRRRRRRAAFADIELDDDTARGVRRPASSSRCRPPSSSCCATSCRTPAGCCRRRRSSTTSGTTTSAARPTSSSPTSPTCAARSTRPSRALLHTLRGVGYVLRLPPRGEPVDPRAGCRPRVAAAASPARGAGPLAAAASSRSAWSLVARCAAAAHRRSRRPAADALGPGRPASTRSCDRRAGPRASRPRRPRPAATALRVGYAVELHDPVGDATRRARPARSPRRRTLPRAAAHRPAVRAASRSPSAPRAAALKWRVVAGRGAGRQRDVRRRQSPLSDGRRTPCTRLLVTSCGHRPRSSLLGVARAWRWYAVRRAFARCVEVEDTAAAIAAGDLSQRVPGATRDRGRPAVRSAQRDARARSSRRSAPRVEAQPPRSGCAVRRRRQPRAAHPAGLDPRLRRALPAGRRPRPADVGQRDAPDRGRGRPDGRPRRGPAAARPARPAAAAAIADRSTSPCSPATPSHDARARRPRPRHHRSTGLDGPLAPTVVRGRRVAGCARSSPTSSPTRCSHTPAGHRRSRWPSARRRRTASPCSRCATTGPGVDPTRRARSSSASTGPTPRAAAAGGGTASAWRSWPPSSARHQGRVGVAQTPGGGATFVVRLPQVTPSH